MKKRIKGQRSHWKLISVHILPLRGWTVVVCTAKSVNLHTMKYVKYPLNEYNIIFSIEDKFVAASIFPYIYPLILCSSIIIARYSPADYLHWCTQVKRHLLMMNAKRCYSSNWITPSRDTNELRYPPNICGGVREFLRHYWKSREICIQLRIYIFVTINENKIKIISDTLKFKLIYTGQKSDY